MAALPPPLKKNPQLPQHPLGAYTDSIYEANRAQLEAEIQQRYGDILQQLGYIDPETNQFVKGNVMIQADRQRNDLGHSLELARQEVDNESQRAQTLFSGYRGTQVAQHEHPFVSALADLDVDIPNQLSGLYEQAGGLMQEYARRDNVLLAEAAGRYDPTHPGTGAGNKPDNPDGTPGDFEGPLPNPRNPTFTHGFNRVLARAYGRAINPGARNPTGGF